MVGADAENGMWAIYGAREGLYKTMCTDWDYVNVRDFEYLNNYWDTEVTTKVTEEELPEKIEDLGDILIEELDIPIAREPLSSAQSKFFKEIYQNPMRMSDRFLEKE
jgi:hypothetical protein